MIGKDWRVPLPLLVSLNSNLRVNRYFVLLTVLCVASSVGMATALEMASRALQVDLARTADAVSGRAQIEIVGGLGGIPDEALLAVREVEGVTLASPLLEATFQIDLDRTLLRVLGFDLAEQRQFRQYTVQRHGLTVRDPLRLLASESSIIIAAKLAERLGLKLGSELLVYHNGQPLRLVVEATLADGGIADAFDGQVAVMDVYLLQQLVNRAGWLDRVDVILEPDSDVEAAIGRISTRVRGAATVRRASLRESWVDSAAGAIRLTALSIAFVGGVVAAMLSYASISLALVRRAPELELLRSIGWSRRTIRRLLWADVVAYATAGTLIGVPLGLLLSRMFLSIASALQDVGGGISASELDVSVQTIAVGLVVGLGASSVGLLAASSSGSRALVGALRAGTRRRMVQLLVLGAVAAILYSRVLPDFVTAAAVFAATIAAIAWSGPYLPSIAARLRPLLTRLLPGVGHLIGTGFAIRPRTAASAITSVAAVASSVAMMFSLAAGFESSLGSWAVGEFPGALRVTASTPFAVGHRDLISAGALRAIRDSPEVGEMTTYYNTSIIFQGAEIGLVAADLATEEAARGNKGRCADVGLGGGQAGASGRLLRKFGLRVGEEVELVTPVGMRSFLLVCSYKAFGGPSGQILLDNSTFEGIWGGLSPAMVAVWPRTDLDRLTADLRTRTAGLQPLFLTRSSVLRRYAQQAASRFDSTLYSLAGLALFLGTIAVGNCLMGIVSARFRELELLRTAGATTRQVTLLVLLDGLSVAVLGLLIGIPLGIAMSGPMSAALGASFGWPLDLAVEAPALLAVVAAVLASASVASIGPALLARSAKSGGLPESLQQPGGL